MYCLRSLQSRKQEFRRSDCMTSQTTRILFADYGNCALFWIKTCVVSCVTTVTVFSAKYQTVIYAKKKLFAWANILGTQIYKSLSTKFEERERGVGAIMNGLPLYQLFMLSIMSSICIGGLDYSLGVFSEWNMNICPIYKATNCKKN